MTITAKMDSSNRNTIAVSFFSGGLTFSWLIVWASFTTAPVIGIRFPLSAAIFTFTAAAIAIAWAKMRCWRNYGIVGLHLIGLAGFVLHTLHTCFFSTTDFLDSTWLAALGDRVQDTHGFLTILLVAGWSAAFWFNGAQLGRRRQSFTLICNRFDAGLTGLFALLLVQLVLVVRGGLTIAAPPEAFFMYAFFLCGLLSIGLVRYRGLAKKQFLPGIRGIAILVAFAVAILAATGILAVVAPPILAPMAEEGYDVLKTAAQPVETVLVRIVRFLFGRDVDYSLGPEVALSRPEDMLPGQTNTWGVRLARIMAQGLVGVFFLALLTFVGYLIWRLIRWLFQRDAGPRKFSRPLNGLFEMILKLWALLQYFNKTVRLYLKTPSDIGRLFAALQAWGKVGGVSHQSWETPHEFGRRLCRRFPQVAGEFNTIIDAFQSQVYGEASIDSQTAASAYNAWRQLRSPKLWLSRGRTLFDRAQTP